MDTEVPNMYCHHSVSKTFTGTSNLPPDIHAEAEASILWPPDVKSRLTGKDLDVGKDREQEQKEVTENEIVGWHHLPKRHGFEQTQGDSKGQGSLSCCSTWGHKELDMTGRLNNKIHFSEDQEYFWPFRIKKP